MYVEQIGKGQSDADISDSISICLAGHRIFPDSEQAHHRFQMLDIQSGKTIDQAVAVHTVELTKYNVDAATIRQRTKIEHWAFLLLKAQDCDASTLRELTLWKVSLARQRTG
jgi:L-ribulose-5-phosphate 3-epimerase UlaE